ncbi:single-stranded-DNA-specific exonuclease RecJ [Uliginosibacterium sp. H3]|uniref:Single-stranded-DNA-specific exonuclease RecJ n=1 Tax=Uliginosibacterium silvisoli TaxID=3114758 RepID=A0ABU6K757_9RHOO|nr:single-stranded-DNA-specific exonuclease RecJ [Uliginosibacterium sp. H3]
MTRIVQRSVPQQAARQLHNAGQHPLFARLFAARGVAHVDELKTDLNALLPPAGLKGIDAGARLLADAIEAGSRMLIVADYDCDGATACAVGMRALRSMGARVSYLVPNRFEYGYGLTPAIVDLAAGLEPELLITVDNGIASIEGVARARELGMATLITDHHLPGDSLPEADVIINPNQPGCDFPSKCIAGVGVMFYVALALRAELRERGWFAANDRAEPKLGELLDLVALGTVADVVKLDANNRILVSQGLARMRAGRMQAGLRALFAVAAREPARASTFDMGFALGPRLNAAGRLTDMSLGIECLITDDFARAMNIAQELDQLNRQRRSIEEEMKDAALATLEFTEIGEQAGISLYEPDWHQGVIGIVAGRIKERAHRPTIAFAPASSDGSTGELKGSGRSIPALHMRDALDLISKRHPDLILKFGGHAMAAGLSIREVDYPRFATAFAETVAELLTPADLQRCVETDGALESGYMSLEMARMLEAAIWGQGFAQPLFDDVFEVESQRILKERHLKLRLRKGGNSFEAIQFNCAESVPNRIRVAYRLSVNEYNGVASVQLMLEHFEPA